MFLEDILKIQEIEAKYQLNSELEQLKSDCDLKNPQKLKEELELLESDKNTLRIGIIGRVKAGKSSLLNALVFKGADVLPQAATPMTAALTVIEHSEQLGASVEVYSENDIAEYAKGHDEYLKELERIKAEIFDDLCKQKCEITGCKELDAPTLEKLKDRSNAQALMQLESTKSSLKASYEQHIALKKAIKPTKTELSANNLDELKAQLSEYVGADGKYTAFTKSIILRLNLPDLKGLQIVDTPGVCDPVRSRGARTQEFLSKCHLCFIVSPAGQFLNEDDEKLLGQIYKLNQISLSVIASKVDTQLRGSERIQNGGDFMAVLASISTKLNARLQEFCAKKGAGYEALSASRVIISSGMAHSMLEHFNGFNDQELKLIANNAKDYPKEFSEQNLKETLCKLANKTAIDKELERAKKNKNELINKRLRDFQVVQDNKIKTFCELANKHFDAKINKLQASDLAQINEQINKLNNKSDAITALVNEIYVAKIQNFQSAYLQPLLQACKAKIAAMMQKANNAKKTDIQSETYTYTETEYEKTFLRSVFSCFGICDEYAEVKVKKTGIRTVQTDYVETNAIAQFLQDACNEVQELCKDDVKEHFKNFKNDLELSLRKQLISEDIEISALKLPNDFNKALRSRFSFSLPSKLSACGRLEDAAASSYVKDLKDFIHSFESRALSALEKLSDKVLKRLAEFDFAAQVVANLRAECDELAKNCADKEAVIARLKQIKSEFKQIHKE